MSVHFYISIYTFIRTQAGQTALIAAQASESDRRVIFILTKVKLDEDAHKNWTCASIMRVREEHQPHYDCTSQAAEKLEEFLQEEAKKDRVRIYSVTKPLHLLVAYSLSNSCHLSQHKANRISYCSGAPITLPPPHSTNLKNRARFSP